MVRRILGADLLRCSNALPYLRILIIMIKNILAITIVPAAAAFRVIGAADCPDTAPLEAISAALEGLSSLNIQGMALQVMDGKLSADFLIGPDERTPEDLGSALEEIVMKLSLVGWQLEEPGDENGS